MTSTSSLSYALERLQATNGERHELALQLQAAKTLIKEQGEEITDLRLKLKLAEEMDKDAERTVSREYESSCNEILKLREEKAELEEENKKLTVELRLVRARLLEEITR